MKDMSSGCESTKGVSLRIWKMIQNDFVGFSPKKIYLHAVIIKRPMVWR